MTKQYFHSPNTVKKMFPKGEFTHALLSFSHITEKVKRESEEYLLSDEMTPQ